MNIHSARRYAASRKLHGKVKALGYSRAHQRILEEYVAREEELVDNTLCEEDGLYVAILGQDELDKRSDR